MKKLLLGFLFLSILLLSLSAQNSSKAINYKINKNWYYNFGDDLSWKDKDFINSSWTAITPPEDIHMKNQKGYFWLRIKQTIPKELSNSQIWFDTGITCAAFDIYVNGVYIGSRGSLPPNFNGRPQLNKAVLIPSNLYEDNNEIVIALRGYNNSTVVDFDNFYLCNEVQANIVNYTKKIWNGELYVILGILCIFIGIYFFCQFKYQPKEKYYFYFAMTVLTIAIYFYDMGSEKTILPVMIQRSFSRSMLSVSIGFMLLFFMNKYNVKNFKKFKPFVYIFMLIIFILFLVLTGNDTAVNTLFTIMLLPIFIVMVYSVIILIRALKRKEQGIIPVLLGFTIGFALSIHDIYCQASGIHPFAWLQGISFFSLNISVFVSLSMQSAFLQKNLDASSSTLKEQHNSLTQLMQKAESFSIETSSIATELDTSVSSVAADTIKLASDAATIGSLVAKQNEVIESVKNAVSGLTTSLSTVDNELLIETESLSRTVKGTASLIDGFASVGEGINGAANFSQGLNQKLQNGRGNMDKLAFAMDQVKTLSADIMNVVTVVNEFAEQTNLLAMNASIEAAHAGLAGKGFSVIALEIKKLASASAQQAERIKEMIVGIEESINDGSELSITVKQFLSEIEQGAKESSTYVLTAAQNMKKQQEAGELILKESKLLQESATNIKKESSIQNNFSKKVQETFIELANAADKVGKAATEIINQNTLTARQAEEMKELATRSRIAAEELASLMQK